MSYGMYHRKSIKFLRRYKYILKSYIKNYNDLYTHLTRIAIYDDKVNQNSKKLSMSLLKYFIVTAYKEVINYNNIAKDESKEIIIENINMTTTDKV